MRHTIGDTYKYTDEHTYSHCYGDSYEYPGGDLRTVDVYDVLW